MTKGARALLFVLGATFANMLLTVIFFIALLGLYGLTLGRVLKLASAAPVILVAFIGAVLLSALAYGKALKYMKRRYKLDERFGLK
jgi:hypothetical protein